ncbi:MAG: magnesium chelatase subunit D [Hyphomicrobiales bacterium]|nr:MAG: magnesium chelatase subunit D [Hyphomicrobiales bacterium]
MRPETDSTAIWRDAVRAAKAFAVAPERLGGLRILGPAGGVRDAYLSLLRSLLGGRFSERRLPPSGTEETLLGGTDLAASLEAKRLVHRRGLLDQDVPILLVVPMAERVSEGVAGILARSLDEPGRAPLVYIALDEGRGLDEAMPAALADRLGLTVDLREIARLPCEDLPGVDVVDAARVQLPRVEVPEAAIQALCAGGVALGIGSLRAPLQAVTLARASAALDGRGLVADEDVAFAARLILAPHATMAPTPEAASPESETDADPDPDASPPDRRGEEAAAEAPPGQGVPDMHDIVIEAARASLPAGLLSKAGVSSRKGKRRQGKSGASRKSGRRGRPLASRPGAPAQGPFDLLATLKAAVPWQRLRAKGFGASRRIAFGRGDIHIRRYRERSESLTIFAVDASGSTAAQRLAEAKGAVELLLADCYVRRDQVALIAFRKAQADVILPPTRSLVRAKRLLAEMPSGGGTPLGLAIAAAADLADTATRNGLSPTIVFLTDGGANTTRDGTADRARAESEARLAARRAATLGSRILMIDVSRRDRPFAREISTLLDARYVKLPRSDAASLAMAVGLHTGQR